MNINNLKHVQFELFPGARGKAHQKEKQPFLFKSLTLSIENIIVLCIIFIMVMVVFFSFGVERGRKLAALDNLRAQSVSVRTSDENNQAEQSHRVSISLDKKMPSQESAVNVQDQKNDNTEIFTIPVEEKNVNDEYFTIQVASFKLLKNAEKEAVGLKKKGYDIFVMPKGSYSIVCVGKFAQEKEAKKFSVKLKNRYGDCLVRRL